MVRLVPHGVAFFASILELRAWLDADGETADELWVGLARVSKGRPAPITWADLVDEILCAGWIDGVRMPFDTEWHAIRITPRRAGSVWSARNVGRVKALRAEGRMRPAGEVAFARRREDRTAIYSFDGGFAFDGAAEAAIRAQPGAWAWFEAQPPGYRRQAAHWVMSAKREETRAGRLTKLIDGCMTGERLPEITGAARRPGGSPSSS